MKKDLLNKLKINNQDFEFYPTTSNMIQSAFYDYTHDKKDYHGRINNFSILDIGAGNGNVFTVMESLLPPPKDEYKSQTKITKYAIEKSEILINNLPADVMVIGTDFHMQTLIDKRVDVIFCNPPYKEYKQWMIKILREANCNYIYFVVPERWKNDKEIMSIINKRCENRDFNNLHGNLAERLQNLKGRCDVIGNDSFVDSEYRKARATVDILKIKFATIDRDNLKIDPFDLWFENNFKIDCDKEKNYNTTFQSEKSKTEKIKELVKGKNLIESLEELYRNDFEKLLTTYKSLEQLDYDLFKELGVDLPKLKCGLKEKIKGLKNLYWKELFDNLNKITEKLTGKSRKRMLDKLTAHTNIDFTVSNAYALIIWVLKNANIYIDDQLKDVYFEMASKDNIKNYKSNTHFVTDTWRYGFKDYTNFSLDYRLVFERYNCFDSLGYNSYDYPNGLSNRAHEFLNDICVIGDNLGFKNINSSFDFEWSPGKENIFYYFNRNINKEFMRIKAYKNGNIHCKPNKEFIMKFNVEMARLNGWVKDQTECEKELNLSKEDIKKYWKSNTKLLKNDIRLIDWSKDETQNTRKF